MEATLENLNSTMTASLTGTVAETIGMTVSVADFPAPVGAVVRIERDGSAVCEGEVVGFRDGHTLVYLLSPTAGVRQAESSKVLSVADAANASEANLKARTTPRLAW